MCKTYMTSHATSYATSHTSYVYVLGYDIIGQDMYDIVSLTEKVVKIGLTLLITMS